MPLELQGRDEENVPNFTGELEAHSTAPWLFVIGTGVLLAAIFLIAGFHALAVQHDVTRFVAAVGIGGLISGSLILGSVWWFRVTLAIPHLASIDDLALRFGLNAARLTVFAAKTGIRPKVKMNGEKLYSARDFGDVASLLRASSGPGGAPGAMLRVAESTDSERLPRPAAPPIPESKGPQTIQPIAGVDGQKPYRPTGVQASPESS